MRGVETEEEGERGRESVKVWGERRQGEGEDRSTDKQRLKEERGKARERNLRGRGGKETERKGEGGREMERGLTDRNMQQVTAKRNN